MKGFRCLEMVSNLAFLEHTLYLFDSLLSYGPLRVELINCEHRLCISEKPCDLHFCFKVLLWPSEFISKLKKRKEELMMENENLRREVEGKKNCPSHQFRNSSNDQWHCH